MKDFRKLLPSVREFKRPAILTIIFIVLEVFIEVVIPFLTADMVNAIKDGAPLEGVVKTGLFLVLLAVLSLSCGASAGYTGSKASAGFARNLRHDVYCRVQDFSFENIDRFSTASLVTRMTTDIGNVQMAFMMIIRIAIRAPLMFVFAIVMAYIMGGALATTFVVLVPVLVAGLIAITRRAMPAFRAVFRKYDKLNESIEENVRAMRVVKGFAREEYEKQKFGAASQNICKDFTYAERIVALNSPLMQLCLYFNMIFVLFIGSKLIISNRGATIDVGQLSAMLTYGFQILMSLMIISMIYVMLTISAESIKRLGEVMDERPTLTSPAEALHEVPDGSIDFEDVSFKYSEKAQNYALSDVDLHIPSGSTVGILGGTGSSKSTLVQLIPRLYDVSEGCVRARVRPRHAAQQRRRRAAEEPALLRHDPRQPALGRSRRDGRGDGGGLPSRAGGRVHPRLPGRLRHEDRAGRLERLRRAEAAIVHRARPAEKAEDPDPRRFHQRRRHPHRRADPRGLPQLYPRDDQDHHRPARGLRPGRGHDPRHGQRPHRRAGHARRADEIERYLPRDLPPAEQRR